MWRIVDPAEIKCAYAAAHPHWQPLVAELPGPGVALAAEHLLLIAVALSASLPYWLLHFEARYVLPTLPLYLAWIALGADLSLERATRARRSRWGALA